MAYRIAPFLLILSMIIKVIQILLFSCAMFSTVLQHVTKVHPAGALHAVKVLRHHGMSNGSLRHVYKAVVLSKLLYASPAWCGFTSATDKQRLEAPVLCYSARLVHCRRSHAVLTGC